MQNPWLILSILLTVSLAVVFLCWLSERRARAKEKLAAAAQRRELQREARIKRDSLLDSVGHAYLLVDDTSHIQFANAAATALLKSEKLLGRTVVEAFEDEGLAVALLKCIRTGKPVSKKVVQQPKSSPFGKTKDVSPSAWVIEAAPYSGDEEELTCVIVRNVTTEHEAEQIRQDFVANASHELRTPMAIIKGYLENLLDDDMLEDPVMSRRFLSVMQKHSNRISRIVEDMLAISKLESGDSWALNKESFLLQSCLDDVADRLSSLLAEHASVLDIDVDPEGLELFGDRFYWEQVFFNLIENALKENQKPGLRVEALAYVEEGQAVIEIADNGKGIPQDALSFIFKRFYRVDKQHTNSEVKGTGLGLSIVKRAVEAHGGTIFVVSQQGVRTCFTIRVPLIQGV